MTNQQTVYIHSFIESYLNLYELDLLIIIIIIIIITIFINELNESQRMMRMWIQNLSKFTEFEAAAESFLLKFDRGKHKLGYLNNILLCSVLYCTYMHILCVNEQVQKERKKEGSARADVTVTYACV